MFSLQAMFGNYDQGAMKTMLMDNQEYLEKVMEKLPYIGEEIKKEREAEEAAAQRDEDNLEEEEGFEGQPGPEAQEGQEVVRQSASRAEHNETTFEKIKRGFTNLFRRSSFKVEGDVLPKDEQYVAVQVVSPKQDDKNVKHTEAEPMLFNAGTTNTLRSGETLGTLKAISDENKM